MKFLNHNLFTGDITVNGTTTLSTATGITRATGDNSTHLATTAFVKAQGYATTAALSGYVPTSRTLTINGTTYDLSANRSWTISSADGYISNVQVVGSTLSFTGVGSAFSGVVDLSTLTPTVRTVFETVKNVSGATILKGTPLAVVAGQTSGNVSDVVPADAADPTKMPAVFIANQNIADETEGEAVLFGNITGINTSAFTSGTTVYVGPGGGWTATKPVWPNLIQNLGVITKQHATNGAGIVTGVGRANASPNLTAGKIWVGSATYPIESTTVHVDEANARVGIGTTIPSAKVDIEGSVETRYLEVNAIAGFAGIGSTSSAMVEFLNAGDGNTLFIKTNNSARTDAAPLAVWTQTNPRFIVRNDGRVGINTSNPASTLHVVGSRILVQDGSNAGLMLNTGGTNRYSVASTSGAFQIYDEVNLTNRLYITSDGLIGLGTITPTALLDVNGSIRVTGRTTPTTGNGLEIFYYSPSDAFYLEAYNYSTLAYKAIRYSGASHQFITGNVGINTTNPTEKLHVDGRARITTIDNGTGDFATISGTGVITRRTAAQVLSDIGAQPSGSYLTAEADTLASVTGRGASTNTSITVGPDLVIQADGSVNYTASRLRLNSHNNYRGAGMHLTGVDSNWFVGTPYTDFAGGFVIARKGAAASFEDTAQYSNALFTVKSDGNVGIGTTSPANTLHTYGASGSTIAIDAGGANNSGLQFKNQGTLAAAITYVPGTSQMHFYRGGDVMVVGSSNVGIGTTSPTYKLDVLGSVRLGGTEANNNPILFGHDSTAIYAGGLNTNTLNVAYGYSGTYNMHINYNGYQGADTQYRNLVVNNGRRGLIAHFDGPSSYVGIGTASPSYKLDVAGAIRLTGSLVFDDLTSNLIQHRAGTDVNTLVTVGHGGFDHNGYLRIGGVDVATQTYVNTAIANLVDSAPSTLDTLNELAAALGDDPNFATTVTNSIAGKVSKSGDTMTGNLSFGSSTRQMINLWSTGYGIGVQSSTTYFRSDSRFSWHRGGSHNDGENNPGGGVVAMTLDSSSNLTVTGTLSASGYNKSNWDTAYGWGNHAGLYAPVSHTHSYLPLSGGTLSGTLSMGNNNINGVNSIYIDDPGVGEGINWNGGSGWGIFECPDVFDNTGGNLQFALNASERMMTLDVSGNLWVAGTYTEASSIRFKENITPLGQALDKVNQLEAVSYNKIGVDDREIGLIAEDVAELFPEVVTYNESGETEGIQYQRLSVILLKAVQELSQEVNELKKKLN